MTKSKKPPARKAQNLEGLLEEAERCQKVLKKDLDSLSFKTRPAHELAQQNARTRWDEVKQLYAKLISERWGAIFVAGEDEPVKAFASIAQEKGPAVVVDLGKLWAEVADIVEPTLRKDRVFEPTQFSYAQRAVTVIGSRLGAKVPALRYRDGWVIRTRKALEERLASLISETGGPLVSAYVRDAAVSTALKIGYHKSVLPVVVLGLVPGEAVRELAAIFGNRVATATMTEPVEEKQVEEAFGDLKKKYPKKA